jgi:hypothetical protein
MVAGEQEVDGICLRGCRWLWVAVGGSKGGRFVG